MDYTITWFITTFWYYYKPRATGGNTTEERYLSFRRGTQQERAIDRKSQYAGIRPSLPSLTEETEHQGEDDASEVAHGADEAGHYAVIEGIAVGN
jgi:hypothetical protein